MTHTKRRRGWIVIDVLAIATVVLLVINWPRFTWINGLAAMLTSGGAIALSYANDPASFHRPMSRGEVVRALVSLMVFVAAVTVWVVVRA